MTPLGSPVEPLENIIVAMSSSEAGAVATCKSRDGLRRQKACSKCGGDTFTEASALGHVLDENRLSGRLDLDLFQKNPCGDDRFQVALLRAGSEGFIRNGV